MKITIVCGGKINPKSGRCTECGRPAKTTNNICEVVFECFWESNFNAETGKAVYLQLWTI